MVDLKEERKYEQLRKLGQELHIPIPEAFWEFEVFDKDHNLIQRHRQRSHSWVRNAYNLLLSQMAGKNLDDAGTFGAGYLNIKWTYGTVVSGAKVASIGSGEQSGNSYRAPAGSNNHGIQVGTATDAESLEDYVLTGLIAEGTGAGQLNYILSEVPGKSYDGPSKVFTITQVRYFNNNSGGAIGVNEVALTTYGVGPGTHTAQDKWVMSRDKLPETVNVPDTGQLKVTYTIQLTYPA
ncbi:hypothetical protein ES703_99274 [subsurface metagenome]